MKKSAIVIFSGNDNMSDKQLLEIMRQISAQTQNSGLRITVLSETLTDLEKLACKGLRA